MNLWLDAEPRSTSELLSLQKFGRGFADRALTAVTAEDIDDALSFCLTAGTYTRYRTMIAAILNGAKNKGLVKEVPKLYTRKDKKKKSRSWLTPEQWDALLQELPKHMKPMATFAVETGLRQENVLQLRWDQVDLAAKRAWFEADEMKGNEAFSIPLNEAALAVLAGQDGQHDDWVFTYRGAPITEIKTAFINACVRAKLGTVTITVDREGKKHRRYEGFTWHGLRHTWATWHAKNGTPMAVLKELGAWADIRMVMTYAHHSPSHVASFADNTRKKE